MPPSDKNKPADSSVSGEDQSQGCSKLQKLNSRGIESPSTISPPGQSMIENIPLITASLPTLECSINDQMKTFDPGEDGGIERLNRSSCENLTVQGKNSNCSSSSVVKNSSKNYKAGSKINKLADMLAKRSQNVVEVTQNSSSDIITDIKSAPKAEETVILNNVVETKIDEKCGDNSTVSFEKTVNSLGVVRKSRRKSVPNPSCNVSQLQLQSASSKSCSDFSKLFQFEENCEPELNALDGSVVKVQTDESTKKKVVRKNLKNVELPLILPERKRRSSMRNEVVVCNKISDKILGSDKVLNSSEGNEGNKKGGVPFASLIQSPNRSAISTKKSKVKQRKSKRLVETSTQTTDIEFISVIKPEISEDKSETESNEEPFIFECLYCTQNFTLKSECIAHEKTHSQKSNKQIIKCQYCFKKLSSLDELKSHCAQKHPYKYAYCIKCDERFVTKEQLFTHNKEVHINKNGDLSQNTSEEAKKLVVCLEKSKIDIEEKQNDKRTTKQNITKADLKVDVSCDMTKKSSVSPRSAQKSPPKENRTEEQLLEQEMLFYSNLSGNIQENLANHLDGKIDNTGHPVRTDQINEPTETKTSSLLSVVIPSTGVPDVQILRAPSPYQTRSKTPNPLPPTAKKFKKLPNWQQKFWEKYNFPTNYRYEHRFWDKNYLNTEKSAFYLKDLSCLDIKTQLTMRENIKKLDDIKIIEESQKNVDKLKFPDYLSLVPRTVNDTAQDLKETIKNNAELLKTKKQSIREEVKKSFKPPVPTETNTNKTRKIPNSDNSSNKKQTEKSAPEGRKMMTRRQSSIDLLKDCQEEKDKKRKGSLDMSTNQRMSLRRQASLDSIQKNEKSKAEKNEQVSLNEVDVDSFLPLDSTEISGEWVRPRSYLCGTCCAKFTNLWELEDHKWVTHPNVWCTHYEFEDEKLDKLFQHNDEEDKDANFSESCVPRKLKLTDLYKRYLLPHGSLKTAKLVPSTNFPEKCTKCKKICLNSSELHKHMLDCGGDTTWFLTMHSSPMTIKRKWRPFGSKRRRNHLGRRDFKRNIPSTPTLRSCHFQPRIRTKPGDVESIQKMLANLPEKRARRAINFDEIKTRSQATIHSNRLLRKRFKSTFATNLLKLQKLKQKRQVKEGRKEGSSKSGTDNSSENTPVGSPKRKNKNKEGSHVLKEENIKGSAKEISENVDVKPLKKKVSNVKKEVGITNKTKTQTSRQENKKKPKTRNNLLTVGLGAEGKNIEKVPAIKEEILLEPILIVPDIINCLQSGNKKRKDVSKKPEKPKKKIMNPVSQNEIKKEPEDNSRLDILPDSHKNGSDSSVKKLKGKIENLNQNVINNKKKSKVKSAKSQAILRLKQNRREKNDLVKRIKKKVNKSRKLLELKQTKLNTENRRSLRIKSQGCVEEKEDNACLNTENEGITSCSIKKEGISSENVIAGNLLKTPNPKATKVSPKTNKEIVDEIPAKRVLRNSTSLEDKAETPSAEKPSSQNNTKKISTLRRSSRSSIELAELLPLDDEVSELTKKPSRNDKSEKSNTTVLNGQIPLPKKIRSSNAEAIKVDVEENKNDSNDLAEMPVLAKVVPIRSKSLGKNEKEIPVLLPVEKEQNGEKGEGNVNENSVSFQVVKKRKKTFKEVTPLKIIKKVDNSSEEVKNGIKKSLLFENEVSNGLSENGKVKKKKRSVSSSTEKVGKKTKTDVKKYFLGICPNEIDKGRGETPEESGSDNEPLISLVVGSTESEVEKNDSKSVPILLKQKKKTKKVVSSNKVLGIKKTKKTKKLIAAEIPKLDVEKEHVSLKITTKSDVNLDTLTNLSPESNFTENVIDNMYEKSKEKILECKTMETLPKSLKKKKLSKKIKSKQITTITLKEPTLKIVDEITCVSAENKWIMKPPKEIVQPKTEVLTDTDVASNEVIKEVGIPERRSRRISKETKATNEFVIDDPLILVDELWSDLDSDSDSEFSKKKNKKGKKKSPKKKTEEKRKNDVDLEELLRNFGENKENGSKKVEELVTSNVNVIRLPKRRAGLSRSWVDIRKVVESRKTPKPYRRLSLQLFQFNKPVENFGYQGQRLSDAKKIVQKKKDEDKLKHLPDLPFLAAEIKENPVQIIQCRSQKSKPPRRVKKLEQKSEIHLKISLPLESISNAVFNNNHLTELIVEEPSKTPSAEVLNVESEKDVSSQETELPNKESQEEPSNSVPESSEMTELKNKTKRSEVIDKIFYCELCKTYYYLYSHLRSHKMSNRHKQKESELQGSQEVPSNESKEPEPVSAEKVENTEKMPLRETTPETKTETKAETAAKDSTKIQNIEDEKTNDDISEMPTLEGPFIENPIVRAVTPVPVIAQPSLAKDFNLNAESLKDLQRAIGCTDEEMLILTLLGDNTIELENDILDLDSCKPNRSIINEDKGVKVESSTKENDSTNGAFKLDLKKRMTSALASLVNKAVFNLIQKYKKAAKSSVNPEALTLLKKLSKLSRRRNILQLNEFLKNQTGSGSSIGSLLERKEPTVIYKYQCTICGSRFEKASTREFHMSRSHKVKSKKTEELPIEEDWNDTWSTYDMSDDHVGNTNTSQFWCSDCGINFTSPQEVLEHQKLEHQPSVKEPEAVKDASPLQSSKIGSSDEIIEGRKTRKQPKKFSSEELDQRRIMANNELRKLDRKVANKSKSNKTKWGMDALRFTVEKDNSLVEMKEEKDIVQEQPENSSIEIKNIDIVPKLNLSRTSNIPEFKVIQKNSIKSRFQKIIDNKLKRKSTQEVQQETETEDVETEVMLVPVVLKKKSKKQKLVKSASKKDDLEKPVDIYDFNESESEGEPMVFSHVKRPLPRLIKLKLVKKGKEGPSRNKADSTTKDLSPDDYDSEDSLPLSVVKKESKPGDEEDKNEKISEDGIEKSEGILEQVEYLIEQLENETGSSNVKTVDKENKEKESSDLSAIESPKFCKEVPKEDSVDFCIDEERDSVKVSVANTFLELNESPIEETIPDKIIEERLETPVGETKLDLEESILAEPESSQSTFDEEDSMPLVLISKKGDESKVVRDEKKNDENMTDISTTASEDAHIFLPEKEKPNVVTEEFQTGNEESFLAVFSSSDNEGRKSEKPFETVNGNVIYCRNDSVSDFGSDLSNDSVHANFENVDSRDSFIKEVTEKEDVVIVCSKGENRTDESKERLKHTQKKKKENLESSQRKKKKRFPLLTATIEQNNFRKSESPKLNKEVIVRRIWNRKKVGGESSDDDEDLESLVESIQNDESQTEVEKEVIVKKIWSRKKIEHDEDVFDKGGDLKINQTEVSDEVVIKCGPRAKASPKRRKSRSSTIETSKETIMRKIWSGKYTFQTKAALKTYDSDMLPNCKENEEEVKPKKRGRPCGTTSNRKAKNDSGVDKGDEDDLDSLLEEIEREQLEKAIRLEFLQLRRSEKANVEILKEGTNSTVGLFTETGVELKKDLGERKRRKVKKKLKHPRQSLIKRKTYLKKPIRKIRPKEEKVYNESASLTNIEPTSEHIETFTEKSGDKLGTKSKIKFRKHKKHRHKHHHHKHKHKKSKHHKSVIGKHKSKHKFESEKGMTNTDSFSILEKICSDIPNQIEMQNQSKDKKMSSVENMNLGTKPEVPKSPFFFENKAKDNENSELSVKDRFETGNIYDFVDDFSVD